MAGQKSKKNKRGSGDQKKTFHAAVSAAPAIAASYKNGIQALLPAHRKGVENAQLATGSIDVDEALRKDHPNDHRWDYGIGLPLNGRTERVLWLEVHHAASGQTDRVIQKLTALKGWLQTNAPALCAMPGVYVWQLSNTENNPNDRRKRNALAEKHGLKRIQGL